MSGPCLVTEGLSHRFVGRGGDVCPFTELSFQVEYGELVAVRGPSGCGKTTLLLICGGMRSPTEGRVVLKGQDLYRMSPAARAQYRAEHLGYLFQTLELIPYLNVLQNVLLSTRSDRTQVLDWLNRLGLGERLAHKPEQLSHGERQRVALARAMAHRPSLVVCDEPTGNLDKENSEIVFEALRAFADDGGAVLVASHDSAVEAISDQSIQVGSHKTDSESVVDVEPSTVEHPGTGARRATTSRTGSVSKLMLFIMASIVLVIGLGLAALNLRPDAGRNLPGEFETVRVYCAAGVAKPVELAIQAFNSRYSGRVEIVRTGGSGELAGQIKTEFETEIDSGADLYLSADDVLLEKAHRDGVIAERFPVAKQRPVIAVSADWNGSLDSLTQLVNSEGLKFGIASRQAAVGKLVRKIAEKQGCLQALESRKTTESENVMTLAQALATGSLDAAVIWDTTVKQLNQASPDQVLKIAAVADPDDLHNSHIGIGVLHSSRQPTAALKFCRFLTGAGESRRAFEEFGFEVVPGDQWEEVPEIHLYCGSMFTPVLEESVREFARREGVNIYPRWQGCGKLVASIEGTQDPSLFPDAFLACDVSFLEQVEDYFQPHSILSTNDIVLVVRKESGAKIQSPRDLLQAGIRFGVCDPEQSALGSLTREMLSEAPFTGTYDEIQKSANVIVDVGPTLISQLVAGGLDAAIVYRSNVLADEKATEQLELIEIRSERATARQPWAIAKATGNAQLMNRLHDWISRKSIRDRFEQFGFHETPTQD